MPVYFWFTYRNLALDRPAATLCLAYDPAWGRLLSFDGGDWHHDGWLLDLGAQNLVLSFNARGPTRPRHRVRLTRAPGGDWAWHGFDYRQRFIRLEVLEPDEDP